jgi:Zn-dependent metalloprotease
MNRLSYLSTAGLAVAAFGASLPANAARLIDLAIPRPSLAGAPFPSGAMPLPAEFKPVRSQRLPNGKVITRYQQYYQGLPIWGQSAVEERQPSLIASPPRLFGKWVTQIQQDLPSVTPVLSASQVLEQAKGLKAGGFDTQNEKVALVVRLNRSNTAQLVYLVSFLVDGPTPSRPFFIIDANSGEVLKQWEGLTSLNATGPGGNKKTGEYEYGDKYGFLPVADDCTMQNDSVTAVDLKGRRNTSNNTPFQFSCPRNTADRAVNGAYAPINDAFYFGNAVVKMYHDWLGLKPISGQLVLHVHYGRRYENAFWDGTSMNFGDGSRRLYPLVAVDVTGHEISHGFTEQNSNLEYDGQSGGINEAFSDMAGAATEYFVKGTNSWQIGIDITKGAKPLRYMDHPANDGQSIENAKDYSEGLDPHLSSGVYNRAFYLLANASGWDVKKAFQVFADANRLYWNASSDYDQAACGVVKAAGERGYDDSAVTEAFKAVGVACKS